MSFHDIKRSRADILFSNHIRESRGWQCEKCGARGKIGGQVIARMEASHYIGRRKRSVRFDEDNVRCLCSSCHLRMGGYHRDENGEYDIWMQELLGPKRYRDLIIRANLPAAPMGEKYELLYVKELIKNAKQKIQN